MKPNDYNRKDVRFLSKILLTKVYPDIDKNLSQKANRAKIIDHVQQYISRNVETLTTAGPTYRTIYNDKDRAHIYEATGQTPTGLLEVLKTIPDVKSKRNILKEPVFTLNSLCTRFALIKKDDELLTQLQMQLLLSMYPSLHAKYFRFLPNKDIMDYTINNLSNRFTIKKETTIFHTLLSIVRNAIDIHTKRLINGEDKYILAYVIDVKTRLSSVMKNIAIEFYENHKKGNYLSKGQDIIDEENNIEYDNNMFVVSRLTDRTVIMLLTNGANSKIVKMCANINQVSVNEMRNYLNKLIVTENRGDMRIIVEAILTYYIIEQKKTESDIKSSDFVAECFRMYKTSNVKDHSIIKIKDVLDKWMKDMGTYEKTNRKGTINSFRRALFSFFVFSIQMA